MTQNDHIFTHRGYNVRWEKDCFVAYKTTRSLKEEEEDRHGNVRKVRRYTTALDRIVTSATTQLEAIVQINNRLKKKRKVKEVPDPSQTSLLDEQKE